MENNDRKTVKVLFGILLFIALIGVEYSYRTPLFERSLQLIEDLSKNRNSNSINFFKIVTVFGTAGILIPIFVLLFNWYPLSKSFAYLMTYVMAAYIDNIMKIIYNNPRPYWVNKNIVVVECNGGFGNPSGHAFSSASVYMALWHITSDHDLFNLRLWLKMLYLGIILIVISLICYSRFYLGVHAINQLIYGASLGLVLYLFIFYILELHKYDCKQFFSQFIEFPKVAIYWSIYISFLVALVLVFIYNTEDNPYKDYVDQKCPDTKDFRSYEYDGMSNGLLISAIMGTHLGFTILYYLLQRNYTDEKSLQYFHEFIYTNIKTSILRILFLAVVAVPTMIPLMAISSDANFAIICIFKISIPYFCTLAIVCSAGLFYAYRLNLTNNPSLNEAVKVQEANGKGNDEKKQDSELKIINQ
jgi:membrane-associated phospholipid phosphatase